MTEVVSRPVSLSTPGPRPTARGRDDFGARLVAESAFVVDADADRSYEYECLILDFGK